MKLRTTLTKMLVAVSGISIILTVICCCVATWFAFSEQAYSDLSAYGDVLLDYLSESEDEYVDPILINDYRVTLIDDDGSIIFESNNNLDENKMENHLTRPEIKQAIKKGIGSGPRYSKTEQRMTYYYAVKMDNGNVLRIAKEVKSIFHLYYAMIIIIVLLAVYILLASLFISNSFAKKILAPFKNMDGKNKEPIYEELRPFADTITAQQRKIRHHIDNLQEEQDKTKTLISNMREGFIMLDVDKIILIENESAKKILKPVIPQSEGKNILEVYDNDKLIDAVNKASKGESCSDEIKLNKKTIKLYVNPVFSSGELVGIICLLLDITAQRKTEKLRQEFTANVTHELKTPLTSISGYAEMIENGMVSKTDDIQRFAGRIHKEAGRLISLISDIMKLSKMDDKAYQIEGVKKVNLKDMVIESVELLEMSAKKNNISIHTELDDVTCTGNETQLYELVFNLCDNAVRYNKTNGNVYVKLTRINNNAVLQVRDTGIGIDKKHQGRIFERFYRVDKSRSKETGGTGLGLAIVKHIAELHNAEIAVESEIDKGTVITVTFYSNKS
ncbi:MAG: ATP-binding protein [Acutalibacteraceae bacterium]|nr:ATP-binding protein [Acutalibacteraceae bacterium]